MEEQWQCLVCQCFGNGGWHGSTRAALKQRSQASTARAEKAKAQGEWTRLLGRFSGRLPPLKNCFVSLPLGLVLQRQQVPAYLTAIRVRYPARLEYFQTPQRADDLVPE